jgi:hypothetical protein
VPKLVVQDKPGGTEGCRPDLVAVKLAAIIFEIIHVQNGKVPHWPEETTTPLDLARIPKLAEKLAAGSSSTRNRLFADLIDRGAISLRQSEVQSHPRSNIGLNG